MSDLLLYYLLGFVLFVIILYWIIQTAVHSAFMEVETKKRKMQKQEKEKLDKLLSEKKISPDEYYQRTLNLPLEIAHEK